MLEAYVLYGEIHRSCGDFEKAFAAYESRLRPFVTAKQKSARPFRGFFAPGTRLGFTVRNLAVRVFTLPFFAKHVMARSLHDDFELPRYAGAA